MILEWLLWSGSKELTIHTAPWECELNHRLMTVWEKWSISNTSMFHIFNWSKVLNALLKLKSNYTSIPEGHFVLKIEGYGTVELSGNQCTDTDKEPQMTLNQLETTVFLLGSIPFTSSFALPKNLDARTKQYLQNVLPLPLWWCNQDRV